MCNDNLHLLRKHIECVLLKNRVSDVFDRVKVKLSSKVACLKTVVSDLFHPRNVGDQLHPEPQ